MFVNLVGDYLIKWGSYRVDIHSLEDPAICGHWRSNTRAHFRRSSFDDLNWSEGLLQGLCGVLDVAGWSIREPDPCLFEIRLSLLFAAVKNLRWSVQLRYFQSFISFVSRTSIDSCRYHVIF